MASQHRPENGEVGAVYLTRAEIAVRVAELGVEIARDYAALDPILIAPLKSSVVFLADLTRELRIPHTLDVIELAPYTGGQDGAVRLLKDVDAPLEGRHVLIVEDVVDTGLTLHFLFKTLGLRNPASLGAVTLLDRDLKKALAVGDLDFHDAFRDGRDFKLLRLGFSGHLVLPNEWSLFPPL